MGSLNTNITRNGPRPDKGFTVLFLMQWNQWSDIQVTKELSKKYNTFDLNNLRLFPEHHSRTGKRSENQNHTKFQA